MRNLEEFYARRLLRDIRFLRMSGHGCFSSHNQDGLLTYLAGVHMTYSGLRRRKWAGRAGRLIAAVYDLPSRERHPIRAIIDATTSPDVDPKEKSRMARALRFAWQTREEWGNASTTVGGFIRQTGGVSGCAAKFAQAKREKRAQ